MNKMRWLTLILVAAITAAAFLCLFSTLFEETQARVIGQGSWCERTGPHTDLPLWSDDGGETWR